MLVYRNARSVRLASVGVAALILTTPATADPPPDTIELTGTVRDFMQAHPDFNVVPGGGFGHCAGNVSETLNADTRPVLNGNGYRVATQWTNVDGRPIAPHLFRPADLGPGGGLNLVANERIRARNTSTIDSYDSGLGPYGGLNVGAEALVATNSTAPAMIVVDNSSVVNGDALIGPGGDPAVVVDDQGGDGITGTVSNLQTTYPLPTVTAPTGLPAYPGTDIYLNMNQTLTVSGSYHLGEVRLRKNAVLTIDGNVTFVCDERFLVEREAQVIVPDGSSLTVYCNTQMRLYGPDSAVNPDTSNPSKVIVYLLGADPYNDQLVLNGNGTMISARVSAPNNRLDLDQSAQFYGTFFGNEVEINNTSGLHFDRFEYPGSGMMCGSQLGDEEGAAGAADDAAISSPESFDGWFDDQLGTNFSLPHTITLVRDAEGVYEYLDGAFHPADNQAFGNEGQPHNNFFTYAIEAEFVYEGCLGQFFEFEGTDDAWLFVDGQLVMDLGGIVPGTEQLVEMDRLGLQDGDVYKVRFFYAHRQPAQANFNVRTNIPFLRGATVASISWPVD